MQLDIFKTATNYVTYYETKTGGSVTFGRWFSEYVSGTMSPVAESIEYSSPTSNAPPIILNQIGHQSTRGFGPH